MTTYTAAGESISGDKIVYCFGVVDKPRSSGGRISGTLRRNGQAWVLRPLKRARMPISREMDSVLCETAEYECSGFQEKGKQTYGSHRGIVGNLIGDATCKIRYPLTRLAR